GRGEDKAPSPPSTGERGEEVARLRLGAERASVMRNVKLVLAYDGSDFNGWQTQPGYRTVQETLEKAIAELTGETRVRVNASGRTDAGVHAVGQVANFSTATHHPAEVIARAVNARLPADVIVREAADVPQAFNAN